MRQMCADMVSRLPQLNHVALDRVLVAFAQARKRTSCGTYASLTPLRFRNGAMTEQRRGRWYAVQRVFDRHGREMLYVLNFYLPRFMDLEFKAKLVTVLHELWHISPEFNGDLRRHAGRCFAHTHSQREYDAEMEELADQWLAAAPPEAVYRFLQGNFVQLITHHGRIVGTKIHRPKLIPAAARDAASP
jgi:hypothetical protein